MARASVIVPAMSERHIDRCISSLLAMDYRNFEIIVVVRAGSGYFYHDSRVRVIEQDGTGRPNALNCGIMASCGGFIAFTGEDCVVSEQWLGRLLDAFDDPEVGGSGSICEAYNPGSTIASLSSASYIISGGLVKKYEHLRAHDTYLPVYSCAFRTEVIRGLAGFDELLPSCEGYDLSMRVKDAGFRLELVPQARIWLEYSPSIKNVASQQLMLGRGDIALAKKYSRKAARLRLLTAIPYQSLASAPYGLTHGMPTLPAFIFLKRFLCFLGALTASPR